VLNLKDLRQRSSRSHPPAVGESDRDLCTTQPAPLKGQGPKETAIPENAGSQELAEIALINPAGVQDREALKEWLEKMDCILWR
jgi:hypothetical protein